MWTYKRKLARTQLQTYSDRDCLIQRGLKAFEKVLPSNYEAEIQKHVCLFWSDNPIEEAPLAPEPEFKKLN